MKLSDKLSIKSLSEYVNLLQSRGDYTFNQQDARDAIGCSDWAIRIAANRLIAKKRIIKLRYTFYLIIPLEYRNSCAPPPAWYIDALMQYNKQPYYVGLTSAAAMYGAAHQQTQIFQVITNKPLRPIVIGRARIIFFVKKDIEKSSIIKKKTPTGYMNVSTPEMTAVDLVIYANRVGSLNYVVTILAELSEEIDSKKLVAVARKEKLIIMQRLGYLLDKYGKSKVACYLSAWLSKQQVGFVRLRTDKNEQRDKKSVKWHVLVNDKIEIDDI